jgi:hypothetical protein
MWENYLFSQTTLPIFSFGFSPLRFYVKLDGKTHYITYTATCDVKYPLYIYILIMCENTINYALEYYKKENKTKF